MIFAGLSGSAIADTAALGGVLIPMMSERGYGKSRATGIVISSGIIANIIPPSIGFILFGVVSGASISRMFMGGLVPGVIIGCALMITWFFTARKDGLKAEPSTLSSSGKNGTFFGKLFRPCCCPSLSFSGCAAVFLPLQKPVQLPVRTRW